MGMASGFPAGAKLTARLRQEGQITRIEAERLVSFTNSSNPIFIFGAVSVGFFHNPQLGLILALSHYLGNICVGIMMRFYGKGDMEKVKEKGKKFHLINAFSILHQTRLKDNRPIGQLLGDAVTSSIQTLLMIGGFIIIFSVLNRMLYLLHITAFLAKAVQFLLTSLSFPISLSIPFISGLFEITLGSQLTSKVQAATLLQQVIITSFILGFSGFSVQAQVASILAHTDIRFKPFFFARIVHGTLAALFAFLLWEPLSARMKAANFDKYTTLPVIHFQDQDQSWLDGLYATMLHTGPLITIYALIFYVLILTFRIKRER
jgi:sporulation integral membrane protein YlbJ